MKRHIKYLVMVAATALMVVIVLNLADQWQGIAISEINAQVSQGAESPARTITVVGVGKARIKADTARATIGVEVIKPSVKEASLENRVVIENVLTVLKEQGIAEEDIQTSGFSVWAERFGGQDTIGESDTRYHVSNNMVVIIHDLNTVARTLDAAIEAGANTMYGIEFTLEDPSAAESKARQRAIDHAHATAEELATLAGVSLGEVQSISEIIGSGGGFYSGSLGTYASGAGSGAAISPGELGLTKQIQVTYAIVD